MTANQKWPRRLGYIVLWVLTGLATTCLHASLDRFFPAGDWHHTVVGDLFIVVTWPALMWITLLCGRRGLWFWLWF